MKTTIKPPITRIQSAVLLSMIACLGLFGTQTAPAGTINVDCQNNAGTVATQGVLPAGTFWNELDSNDSTAPVQNDNGTTITGSGVASGSAGTSTDPGANPIQADSISSLGGTVSVSIFGLRPGKYYKLVVYNSQETAGISTVMVAGGGPSKTAGPANNPASVAAMVKGQDYVVFESLKADGGGGIGFSINHPTLTKLAGFQVQGWVGVESFPFKTDLQISKKKGKGYKGNDKYTGNQSQTVRGKRSAKFFFRIQNDGNICGTYGARAKGSDRNAVRKYFDVTTGRKNVTAKIKSGTYLASVAPGKYAVIQAKVKPKGDSRKVKTTFTGVACDDTSAEYGDKNKAILVK